MCAALLGYSQPAVVVGGEGFVPKIARQSDANGAKSWSMILDKC